MLHTEQLCVMLPPVVQEDGSTASTDTLCPRPVNIFPTTSMKDDFPAPGGPDRPERSTERTNQQQNLLETLRMSKKMFCFTGTDQ